MSAESGKISLAAAGRSQFTFRIARIVGMPHFGDAGKALSVSKGDMSIDAKNEAAAERSRSVELVIARGEQSWTIKPAEFDDFPFEDDDRITIIPRELGDELPVTWGDRHVEIVPGRAIRVPSVYKIAEINGFRMPAHLISLTGEGPARFEELAKALIDNYQKYSPFDPDMTIVDLGCGMARLAFQLFNFLNARGRYIGIDVVRDSMAWCQKNITPQHPNFTFHHFDAFNELYNPYGCYRTKDFRMPAADRSVDRIFLSSVFTHLLEDEVMHYLREFRRVLKPDGLAHASFFLYPEQPINLPPHLSFLTFENHYGNGVYGCGEWKRGAVAYTDEAMRRMIGNAGLRLVRPYLKGWWSGVHGDAAEFGQDAAILARDPNAPRTKRWSIGLPQFRENPLARLLSGLRS